MRTRADINIAKTALLCAVAVIFSYVETLSGIDLLMPVPGIKLGIANIAVLVCAYIVSLKAAFAVSLLRVCILSLLFGSVTSFFFSLSGAVLSFLFIALSLTFVKGISSPIGVSAGSAALHMTGQIFAACVILEDVSLLRLLPYYLLLSLLCGVATGVVSSLTLNALAGISAKNKN